MYISEQLNKIDSNNEFIRFKITDEFNATNWINLNKKQFEAIKLLLKE